MRGIVRRWWFKWLAVGILLRLVLMPITLHPDLWGHSFTAYFFAYEGVINIYEHLLSLASDHPLVVNMGVADIFIYPPLTYFTLGIFRLITRPFVDPNFIPWLMVNLGEVYKREDLLLNLFLFKLPYLFVEVLGAFILAGLFDSKKKRQWAFILWMFNPLSLYATFMMGQLDLLPTFFTILCLYFMKRKRYSWALVSLGVGGSYKMYPLLFVFPAAFWAGKRFGERAKYVALGFLPFILTILPFLNSVAFRQMVLFSPKSQKMLFMVWPVSGAEGLFPFLLILSFIYFWVYYFGKKLKLESVFLAILLLIFSVTHYHPQWFLWLSPLLIWELVENDFRHVSLVLVLFMVWVFLTLMFEPSLSLGLFGPVLPEVRETTNGLADVLARFADVNWLKSLVRSIFAGASASLVVLNWKSDER